MSNFLFYRLIFDIKNLNTRRKHMSIKGNMVVAQSGGPSMVINRSLIGVLTEALKYSDIQWILGGKHGIEGILKEQFIDLRKEVSRRADVIAKSPGSALGSCRKKPDKDVCLDLFKVFKKYDVRYFFYIGGNDSAKAASIVNDIAKKEKYELRTFHVPKTIDNDLLETDHCPGYGSAARYVALAFKGNDMDNRALPGIKIDICMGRNAGWLTAASALARERDDDGPHLIYLPERPKSLKDILNDIDEVYTKYGRATVAVSEGICGNVKEPWEKKDKKTGEVKERGEAYPLLIYSKSVREELKELGMESLIGVLDAMKGIEEAAGGAALDEFGHPQLSGSGVLGDFLASAAKIYFFKKYNKKVRVRSDTLGYPQRSFPDVISESDAEEAFMVGEAAVKYAIMDDVDASVAIKRIGEGRNYAAETFMAKLEVVGGLTLPKGVANHKLMDDKFISEKGNNVTPAFFEYAWPLVGLLPHKGLFQEFYIKAIEENGINKIVYR